MEEQSPKIEKKSENTLGIVLGIIMVIAIIAAFAAGMEYGERNGFDRGVQKGMEDSNLLMFEVVNFADYEPVYVGYHKVSMDSTTILFDTNNPLTQKENITMYGIKVHRYPKEVLERENAKRIADDLEEAAEKAAESLRQVDEIGVNGDLEEAAEKATVSLKRETNKTPIEK